MHSDIVNMLKPHHIAFYSSLNGFYYILITWDLRLSWYISLASVIITVKNTKRYDSWVPGSIPICDHDFLYIISRSIPSYYLGIIIINENISNRTHWTNNRLLHDEEKGRSTAFHINYSLKNISRFIFLKFN